MEKSVKKLRIWLLAFIMITAQSGFWVPVSDVAHAADNGLGQKPYMGWSSYSMQVFTGNNQIINAESIKEQSDAMHATLQSHGYEYINVDAGWLGDLDGYGRPIPSAALYPNGLQEVIDYVHANGQKFGLYTIPGVSPQAYDADLPIYGAPGCSMRDIAEQPLRTGDYWGLGYKVDFSNPCAQKYIDSVADVFGDWGIDFLKFDSVTPGSGHNDTSIDARGDVAAWSQALEPHGIWLELSWALDPNYAEYWKQYANGWRVDWDVECYCENTALTAWPNIARLFPRAAEWWRHAEPGGWNDFDSLNIGNGAMDGLTQDERMTAMNLWAMSSAQLYTGNDLTNLDSYGISLLTNDEVIAINQAGKPAHPVSLATNQQVWYANNGDGTFTVGLFNLGSSAATVSVNWGDIGLTGSAEVRDLWSHSDLGTFATGYSAVNLPSHASKLFKVTSNGGTVTVNDDVEAFKYTGEWTRNGGKELKAGSQNLVISVGDTSIANSSIQPTQASFNKKTSARTDVEVTMALGGNTLSGISNGGAALVAGTDYSIAGNAATIKKEYLAAQSVGTTSLVFSFSAGAAQTLNVAVSDTTNGVVSSYNDTAAGVSYSGSWGYSSGRGLGDYNNDVHYAETNGASFAFPFAGTGIDYVTEKDESQGDVDIYIDDVFQTTVSTYNASRLAQQSAFSASGLSDGMHVLKAVKKSGVFMLLDRLNVTAPDLIVPNQGAFDKKTAVQADVKSAITPGGPAFSGVSNGGTALAAGADFTVSGNDLAIKKEYLATLPVGKTNLSVQFAGGDSQTLVIDVQDTSAQTIVLNDSDPGIVYSGNWGYSWSRGLGDYNDDVHYTEGNNNFFQYAFTGTGIELVTEKDNSQGEIDVYLDDVLQQTVNTYNGSRLVQQTVFSASGLPNAPHTLKVVKKSGGYMLLDRLNVTTVAGSQNSAINPASASFDHVSPSDVAATVALNGNGLSGIANGGTPLTQGTDYALTGNQLTIKKEYLATLPEGTFGLTVSFTGGAAQSLVVAVEDSGKGRYMTINDGDAGISYSGGWSYGWNRGLGDYNDDVHYVEANDAYFEYAFNGTGIEYITEKDNSQGTVDVYVDGVLRQSVSTARDGRQSQQLVYKAAGLTAGPHTLKVVKKSGNYMLLDRLDVRVDDLISPDAASFDKKTSAQADVTVNVSTDASNLIAIKDGGTTLTPGTDYTISGNQVTIKKEYLASKPVGATRLAFGFRGDYMDDVHGTATNNDSFEFAFKGTGVELIGPKGPSLGNVDYYVDNVLKTTVNANSANRMTEQTLYGISGLPYGEHTIKGVKKSGSGLLVDKARFTVPAQTLVNDSDSAIAYSNNGWSHLTNRGVGDYEDDIHFHSAAPINPPYLQYTFSGTGIEIIMEKDALRGEFNVMIDGVFKATVNAYSPMLQARQLVYNLQGLAPGTHTIKLLKKSGLQMTLDALRVTH